MLKLAVFEVTCLAIEPPFAPVATGSASPLNGLPGYSSC
jgi:hypothetical protein